MQVHNKKGTHVMLRYCFIHFIRGLSSLERRGSKYFPLKAVPILKSSATPRDSLVVLVVSFMVFYPLPHRDAF